LCGLCHCLWRSGAAAPSDSVASGRIIEGGAAGCGEKPDETFDPLLLGSEQFRLQQSRAMEACGVLLAALACLQQSGRFDIGQEPSLSCAPTPTVPPSRDTRMNDISHFRMEMLTIWSPFFRCQALPWSVDSSPPFELENVASRSQKSLQLKLEGGVHLLVHHTGGDFC
jgi:hypothetical protein